MMGSVVGFGRQRIQSGEPGSGSGAACCAAPKSFLSGATRRDQSPSLPDDGGMQSSAETRLFCTGVLFSWRAAG